jgi:hypothetical protein
MEVALESPCHQALNLQMALTTCPNVSTPKHVVPELSVPEQLVPEQLVPEQTESLSIP